jgi:hypothetical protein
MGERYRAAPTWPLLVLLLPFVFATGLHTAGAWLGGRLMGLSGDPAVAGGAAALLVCMGAMLLVAGGYRIGGILAAFVGLAGLVAAVGLWMGGGDDLSTRWFPVIVAVLSASVIAVALRWILRR